MSGSPPDRPNVQLDVLKVWCPRHLEPFRARYPRGVGAGTARLFERTLLDARFARAVGHDPARGTKADMRMAAAVLVEWYPLCCFVGDADRAFAYEAIELGDEAAFAVDAEGGGLGPPTRTVEY
jgi:hypothetical protein